MAEYIVVTLGPVFDTINLASSPAALWAGSYLFSYLNKTICRLLVKAGVKEEDILTPYYTAGADFPADCDGVGLYPDRIIFRAGDFSVERFANVKELAIAHLAETFAVEESYLKEYLLIAAAKTEAEHPILDTGKLLDCLELAKPIVTGREDNPLLTMLVGEKNYGNENIKNLPLTRQFKGWHLQKNAGQLKSLGDISGAERMTGMKKHAYYAIVRADGDHMGDVIKTLNCSESSMAGAGSKTKTVREFSKDCIFYCAEIAKKVRDFGGVAIYSGGDDLLAIMPCENEKNQTVFDFVEEANRLFTSCFNEENYGVKVSLSFGITICYHKFPLYEALQDSQTMLFGQAKSRRDCTAIHLQKHAGQSECLIIPNMALASFKEIFAALIGKNDSEWFHSVHHKLKLFRHLFLTANEAQIKNLFDNLFDADAHSNNQLLHERLPRFYLDMKETLQIACVVDQQDPETGREVAAPENETVDTLCYILRLVQFYVEKGGNEA